MKVPRIRKFAILPKILNSVQWCVYLLGIILTLWIFWKIGSKIGTNTWPPASNEVANWSQMVIAYAAIFAIGQYAVAYVDISDRKTKTVLEFIKFFRENVIEKGDEILKESRKLKEEIPQILLRKNTGVLEFTQEHFFEKIASNQKDLIEKYIRIKEENPQLEALIRSCLNSIEEFSIGILNTNSQNHIGVSSIKKPFLETIENLSVPLYCYIGLMDDKFPYSSLLYKLWKKDLGFLPRTKEDSLERYKERQSSYREKQNRKS